MAKLNKKGIEIAINSLIGILLVIITLIFLLLFLANYILHLNLFAKDITCEASFIVSAMSRPLLTVGNPQIAPECQIDKLLIVNTPLKQEETGGSSTQAVLKTDYVSTIPDQAWDTFLRVKNWNDCCTGNSLPKSSLCKENTLPESAKYPYFTEYAEEIGTTGRSEIDSSNPTQDERDYVQKRYNLDKIFADEMKRCWNVVGNGKLALFDTWYQFFTCNYGGTEKACESADDYFDGGINIKGVQTAARFCVLCSRIKIDSEVSQEFKGIENGKYDSLNVWMANNPRQVADDKSYYEYILDESQAGSMFTLPHFSYSLDKPYAVVFVRLNMNGPQQFTVGAYDFLLNSGDDTQTNANILILIPYENISSTCDYLVASTV
jgi:hypothetical protein